MNLWDLLCEATIDAVFLYPAAKEIRIDLTIPWEKRPKCKLVASGVEDFLVNEMSLSNIVDRLIRYDEKRLVLDKNEVAQRLFFLMRGKNASETDLAWPALEKNLSLIRSGDLTLIEIEPVYGASILLLAKTITLEEKIEPAGHTNREKN